MEEQVAGRIGNIYNVSKDVGKIGSFFGDLEDKVTFLQRN